ncbi:MAG: hypothetical protein U5L45_27105 [Saprospiraceae bacterium]|nr:hypothetical protein [Saprospiraceae bacterium]
MNTLIYCKSLVALASLAQKREKVVRFSGFARKMNDTPSLRASKASATKDLLP